MTLRFLAVTKTDCELRGWGRVKWGEDKFSSGHVDDVASVRCPHEGVIDTIGCRL